MSHSDWVIYNEVIRKPGIRSGNSESVGQVEQSSPFRVVDLGANVGYFSLRFADLFLQRFGPEKEFTIILVEGSPAVFAELQRRVREQPILDRKTNLICGLVGQSEGGAYIEQGYIHYGYGASSRKKWGAKFVSYVDLPKCLGQIDQIDLLKCDIEGAEFDLIDNYQTLFSKVRSAVFEFHYYGRDVDNARQRLPSTALAGPLVISAVAALQR